MATQNYTATKLDAIETAATLTTEQVLSVYSGRAHECCCGCKGKHYGNPERRADAEKHRGYAYDEKELSARMVTKVVRLIQEHATEAEGNGDNYVFVELDGRWYIAYLG